MNLVWNAMKSIVKIAYWKCRYTSRIRIPWVQGFDRVHIELSKDAQMRFGQKNQNRGELRLICEKGGKLEFGSHIFCNTGVCISAMGHVKIGDYCKFGNHLVIVDHDHNFREHGEEYSVGEITIGERVWIGANCTILKNVHIGNDCVIAAGSVVKEDIPDGMLYYQKKETACVPLKKQ
ncbi:MAG: acyltransferase [Lachnospiraceae bacterium]|nr:acyltransferase [Lachnospiraceae bacterium]